MPNLTKVAPGQDLLIPASTYNAFIDAAIATRAGKGNGTGIESQAGNGPDIIRVKNSDGATLARFDAVALATPVLDPTAALDDFKNSATPQVATLSASNNKGAWGVMLDATPDKGYGRCCIDGVTVAWINVKLATDTAVEIVSGSKIPVSNPSGSAQILWVAGGVGSATATGNQWAIIRLGGGTALPMIEYGKVVTVSGGSVFRVDVRPCDAAGNFLHSDTSIVVHCNWQGPMTFFVNQVVQFVRYAKLNALILRSSIASVGGQSELCWVSISSNATGQGKYNGSILNECRQDIPTTGSVQGVSGEFPTFGGSCLVVNLAEYNLGTANQHILTDGIFIAPGPGFYLARFAWYNSSLTPVVYICALPNLIANAGFPTITYRGLIFLNTTDSHVYCYTGSIGGWKQLDN